MSRIARRGVLLAGIASAGLVVVVVGCDEPSTPPVASAPATTTASEGGPQSAIEAAASQPVDPNALRPLTDYAGPGVAGGKQRLPLIAVPMTAEVPGNWSVQSGAGGQIVLAPKDAATGVEILLSTRAMMKPEAFELLAKDLERSATQPANPQLRTTLTQRDGMRIIEEIERIAGADANPDTTPYRWTVRYVVPSGGIDFAVYEFNVIGLSETMFKAEEQPLRELFNSVQVDPAALNASTQPVFP